MVKEGTSGSIKKKVTLGSVAKGTVNTYKKTPKIVRRTGIIVGGSYALDKANPSNKGK